MAIDPTGSAVKTATPASSQVQRDKSTLGKDDFLKILVGQMSNMDPMSASSSDPSQSMQQMTQFSILEQLTNLSNSQSAMADSQKQAQSLALLGKTVSYTASDGTDASDLVKKIAFDAKGTATLTLASGLEITPPDVSGVQ
jgi:flagellar basal-body rod modification protein FlgD